MIVNDVFDIGFAISNRHTWSSWGWILASGILYLVLGIYLSIFPVITIVILPFTIGFWLLLHGFRAIASDIAFKSITRIGEGRLILLGIVSIILAILILVNPGFGVVNLGSLDIPGFIQPGYIHQPYI